MFIKLICALLFAASPEQYTPASQHASTATGGRYTPRHAVDGNAATKWASADHARLPQWLELRFDKPVEIDTVKVTFPVHHLYSPWKEARVSFDSGEPVAFTIEPDAREVLWRFEPRTTAAIRIAVLAVYEKRHYVGLAEAAVYHDPDVVLASSPALPAPRPREDIEIRRGRSHPCVNFTPEDIGAARARVEEYAWAKAERDAILGRAGTWLRESGEYWLRFLPEPGACYAYGFTGCPICGAGTGTWASARCSWDDPGHVRCANGHRLPDEQHPDAGTGYVAEDGRIHYFVGQFNAWVTEQWTRYALPALSRAYALTGDEEYAARAALFLDALASIYAESTSGSWDYPSDSPSGRFARPWYQVARTLITYVDQYDLIHNSPALDADSLRAGMTRRENIEEYMLENGAYYCYRHSFSGSLHNGHADYMRGALAVGCLLDIPEYVRHAVESPYSIHAMLANNIDRDGRYYETALGYAIHARNLYLTFADPLYNLRSAEYPSGVNLYAGPKFVSCMLLPELQVMVAGRKPNFGDAAPDITHVPFPEHSFSATDYGYLERLYARARDAQARERYGAALRWLANGEIGTRREQARDRDWLLWHAAPPPQAGAELDAPLARRVNRSWVAGMKGMAVLRLGEQAALLRFGPSLTHGDPDDLGLLYYAGGREWTYDLGYGLGSTHTHVGWASSTVSHCLVAVNERDQLHGPGSGGGLLFLADLPRLQAARATSELSYASEEVSQYQRTAALTDAGYLVDFFRVKGGTQHDYSFGSFGQGMEPFGVPELASRPGSLAEGVAWGERILPDGDIEGYPNKPYWDPPPGNGYGFFYNVRRGQPEAAWGAVWQAPDEPRGRFRVHVAAPEAEAIFAGAPGLYPSKPDAAYLLARRTGEAPLESRYAAVWEPFAIAEDGLHPHIASVRAPAPNVVEVHLEDGALEVFIDGPCHTRTACGRIRFNGAFAHLVSDGAQIRRADLVACALLEQDGTVLDDGPAAFSATVAGVNLEERAVRVDADAPEDVAGRVAIFSNPKWTRTSAYHIAGTAGDRIHLEASTLLLGRGQVREVLGDAAITSAVPHEYARHMRRSHSARFFDGKMLEGARGGTTRVASTTPGQPLRIDVEDASVFESGESFVYRDISPGDTVTIHFLRSVTP